MLGLGLGLGLGLNGKIWIGKARRCSLLPRWTMQIVRSWTIDPAKRAPRSSQKGSQPILAALAFRRSRRRRRHHRLRHDMTATDWTKITTRSRPGRGEWQWRDEGRALHVVSARPLSCCNVGKFLTLGAAANEHSPLSRCRFRHHQTQYCGRVRTSVEHLLDDEADSARCFFFLLERSCSVSNFLAGFFLLIL